MLRVLTCRVAIVAAIVPVLWTPILGFAADWPTYMHDVTRVGKTGESLDMPLSGRWVYSSPSEPQRAWPGPGDKTIEGLALRHRVRFDDVFHVAVVGGRVFFGSSVDNHVYCLDVKTGQTQWSFCTGAPVRLAPTVHDGRLYVGSDDGYVYCLNPGDGSLVWKLHAGPQDERILARGRMASRWPVRTGVLVDGGVAYFGAGVFPHETVYLYAADAVTGKVLWKNDKISQTDAGRNDLTPQGYLLATKDLLFVPSGRTLPAAFDRATGEFLHKQSGGGKQVGGSQAFLVEDHLFSVGEHYLLALDQEKGSIDNRLRGRQMTLSGNMAYVAGGGEILAIDYVRYSEFSRKQSKLRTDYANLLRSLRRHPAYLDLAKIRTLRNAEETLKAELKNLADRGKKDSEDFTTRQQALAKTELELAATLKHYEGQRQSYQDAQARAEGLRKKLDELASDGIAWRANTSHESAMILTADALIVGGIGEVVALGLKSGEPLWKTLVDGEARGLAASDGHLFVSTTTGKIYCFGDAANKPSGETIAIGTKSNDPYPEDQLTRLYADAADAIIEQTGARRGYCLVVGSERGRLAYQLAQRSDLTIYCIESNAEKVAASRRALSRTGLYGTRITVDHLDVSVIPHPSYFANLIVSDSLLLSGKIPADPIEVARCLKPIGGMMCLGVPDSATAGVKAQAAGNAQAWLADTRLSEEGAKLQARGNWRLLTRGVLPNADSWSHQYGNPGNTSSNEDRRVSGGLSVLWYGDPGPSKMLNRHVGAVGPVSAHGRLFVQGDENVMAYDAYNGQFLWELKNTGALRTGVFNNYEPGNLVASEDSLFVVILDKCLHIDAATGEVRRTYTVPEGDDDASHQWGYIAYKDGLLYGTSTDRKLIAENARRRGKPSESNVTDKIFAVDTETGKRLWTYQGNSISHTTIAIGDDRVYFIDSSITSEQREALLREDKSELKKLTGEARQLAEERMKRIDVRRAVAINSRTGEQLWANPVDVTDCTGVGIGAGQLTLMYHNNHVVLCGANANGHYWKQFLAGEFKRRRIVTLSAEDGKKLWAKDANYRHRPIIIGQRIVAEPWAFDLYTGKQETRIHPLTGEETPWKFARPGHHCGAISATPSMMFFRSGFTAYYDLDADSGTRHFAGHRLGCWINTIPANGLVMIPEASAGCACLFSLTSTIVFEPRHDRQVWGVYSAEGVSTPVRHMALNFAAPGDRRDAHGKLWLAYPRPSSRAGIDLPLNLAPNFVAGGRFVTHNTESYEVAGTDIPWVYASAAQGLTRAVLPLIAKGQAPAKYGVRLYFTAEEDQKPGQQRLSIKLQGKTVAEDIDIVSRAGGPRRALVLEYKDVTVGENLIVELVSAGAGAAARPALCGIEVIRAGESEITQ